MMSLSEQKLRKVCTPLDITWENKSRGLYCLVIIIGLSFFVILFQSWAFGGWFLYRLYVKFKKAEMFLLDSEWASKGRSPGKLLKMLCSP